MSDCVFPRVALRDVLQPVLRSEVPVPGRRYRQLGVRLWGEGAYERETMDGAATKYSTLSRVKAGDVVVNKIWARNGSVAVVPAPLEGCFVSGEFPTFEPIEAKTIPQWVHWLTKMPTFWQQCDQHSRGTSGKNRIRPEQFLNVEIPLPPLEEQRRIVARLERLHSTLVSARGLRQQSDREWAALEQQTFALTWNRALAIGPLTPLRNIAAVIDPQPDHRTPAEVPDGLPYVSIANISADGHVDVASARKVSTAAIEKQEAEFTLQSGDMVIGKIGTVGAARQILVSSRFALSANLVLVQSDRTRMRPDLLLCLLRSSEIASQLAAGSNVTAQAAFGIKKMRQLLVPVPSLEQQRHIIRDVRAIQYLVAESRRLCMSTSKELNALLPSILDRAFKGEL